MDKHLNRKQKKHVFSPAIDHSSLDPGTDFQIPLIFSGKSTFVVDPALSLPLDLPTVT